MDNGSTPISELYDYASGNPALSVLRLAAEFSQKPICLYQAESDPFPEPDVQAAANQHGEGVVVSASGRNGRAAEKCVYKRLNYWQARCEDGTDGIGINRRISSVRIVYATKVTRDSQNMFEVSR